MPEPTAALHPDGRAFDWTHDCADYLGRDTRQLPIGGDRGWQLIDEHPLTLLPSIHCHNCGTHGWITEGRWNPA